MGDEFSRPRRFAPQGSELDAIAARTLARNPPREPPAAGRRDPGTSHRAAAMMRRPGKLAESETLILGALSHNPGGLTACQIAERLAFKTCRGEPRDYGWWRLEVSRRMRRLVRADKVTESRVPVRCPVAGTMQTLWIPIPKTQHWLERQESSR